MYRALLQMVVLSGSLLCSLLNCSYAADTETILLGETLSQSKQQEMTPKQALIRLKEGNQRFLTNKQLSRDYLQQAKQSSYGQFPFAVVLNCMDSRSIPEFFFDQGLADLFTLRVAGNVVNDDILGSMEFATKVVGSRLVVVLAHTSCGAVAGACSGVEMGHLTDVLHKIEPVVEPSMKELGVKNCADPKLVDTIARNNALHVVQDIQARSPILRELVKNKKVGIIAGIHNIKTGQVTFFDEERSVPE
ncbi:carbonic anhydrase family protein [Legionella shakespearei]|uniref:carbonic anhydrase n=1 Tax=Legionella shakespearei DSM 23087 TaxID=1122169 RepID=A0A0W0YQS6_9GAMM|nr:carbonic anhydrase family protein [Legionella shakespearei]KTD59244.1 carbonic anhydrase [Legionella shakespearei DSM 23087]